MPPDYEESVRPLSPEQVKLIRIWIDQGAKWPADVDAKSKATSDHWSFQPVIRHDPPPVQNSDWARNPIDRFVLARLEQEGIQPPPEADRHTLIKRLYYDLLGLPPTLEEVDRFVGDQSPSAYEKLMDEILNSPHFGERWGRHWLDKARYADSDGYEKDRPRPNAWRYRDWVIEAINKDMAFDRFTIEQIAGDLLPNSSPIERLATAFNRQTLTNTEGGVDQEEFRVLAIKDRINTLGTVWLGLTVGCADCHSHKYDPITQREYYQLFAFFNNADEINTELPNSDKPVRVIGQRTSNPRKSHVLRRGDFLQPAAEVEPAALELLHPLSARNREGAPDRLDLAEWLVDPANPLTPRVVVNHIWTHLFGWGLVTTVSDFGVRGAPPTHPRLLDWLATELIERGWSRKSMIKLIVSSATYRQSSRHRPDLANTDSLNNLLARQNRFRVDAEIVRDLYLAASGLLTQKIGGPSVYPPMPADVAELSYANNFKWTTSKGDNRYRRGMYTFFKRTSPHPNLIAFDCPDANTTNVQRWASNTPIQALTTLNNEVFVEAAQAMARRVLTAAAVSTDADRITYAFRLCVARAPSEADRNRFVRLLLKARAWYGERPEPARELVGRYQPDGVTPVEAAAWVATARILLNMDEFITRE